MRDETTVMRDALATIRGELDARRIPHKVSAAKAGVGISTWLSWFPADGQPQVPSLAFLPRLANALPGDLLSLLVPDGFHIVRGPNGVDYDDYAAGCMAFLQRKEQAHRPESPAGRDLSDCEKSALDSNVVRLRA